MEAFQDRPFVTTSVRLFVCWIALKLFNSCRNKYGNTRGEGAILSDEWRKVELRPYKRWLYTSFPLTPTTHELFGHRQAKWIIETELGRLQLRTPHSYTAPMRGWQAENIALAAPGRHRSQSKAKVTPGSCSDVAAHVRSDDESQWLATPFLPDPSIHLYNLYNFD